MYSVSEPATSRYSLYTHTAETHCPRIYSMGGIKAMQLGPNCLVFRAKSPHDYWIRGDRGTVDTGAQWLYLEI